MMNWREYCINPEKVILNNRAVFLESPGRFFGEMMKAVDGAKRRITLEFYIFGNDAAGKILSEKLMKKAEKGIEVYLIYDSVGSLGTSDSFFDKMKRSGIKVAEYHPIKPWKPHWNWFRRDHKKNVCVDSEISFLGGMNISADSAPPEMGGRNWKDCGVKMEGEISVLLENEFFATWEECGGEARGNSPRKFSRRYGETPIELLCARGIRNRFSIRRGYKRAIGKARKNIYIMNAYFLPDRFIRRRLVKAAQRKVDVKIIVPSKTDHPYIKWASMSMFPKMIRSGIEIYEWQGEVLHSKLAAIDGIMASVGSHNLDHRSLYYNLEMNANIYDPDFVSRVEYNFVKDLENCRQITLRDCLDRPFLSKAAGRILYWLKGLL